jgi:hypothetical protein
MDEDTPRSVGFGSPRDDRFYTPRTIARTNSNSNSDEWQTPRFETPRYGYSQNSDSEYQTPRTAGEYPTPRGGYSARGGGGASRETSPRDVAPPKSVSSGLQQGQKFSSGAKTQSRNDRRSIGESDTKDQSLYRSGRLRTDSIPEEGYRIREDSGQSGQPNMAAAAAKNRFDGQGDDEEEDSITRSMAAAGAIVTTHLIHFLSVIRFNFSFDYSSGLGETDIDDVFSFTRHGRAGDIEAILDRGMPVDVRDGFGNTLLIIACQNGNKRVAKALLRRGANINSRNYKGNTPLHYCFQCMYSTVNYQEFRRYCRYLFSPS